MYGEMQTMLHELTANFVMEFNAESADALTRKEDGRLVRGVKFAMDGESELIRVLRRVSGVAGALPFGGSGGVRSGPAGASRSRSGWSRDSRSSSRPS